MLRRSWYYRQLNLESFCVIVSKMVKKYWCELGLDCMKYQLIVCRPEEIYWWVQRWRSILWEVVRVEKMNLVGLCEFFGMMAGR